MLSQKPLVETICGPDMEVYVRDPIFLRIAAYLIGDGFCCDFSAEFVPDSEYTAMCESLGKSPD